MAISVMKVEMSGDVFTEFKRVCVKKLGEKTLENVKLADFYYTVQKIGKGGISKTNI